ncbi:hypothetical protein LTR28_009037, partial [Elasticomyces elasticus]
NSGVKAAAATATTISSTISSATQKIAKPKFAIAVVVQPWKRWTISTKFAAIARSKATIPKWTSWRSPFGTCRQAVDSKSREIHGPATWCWYRRPAIRSRPTFSASTASTATTTTTPSSDHYYGGQLPPEADTERMPHPDLYQQRPGPPAPSQSAPRPAGSCGGESRPFTRGPTPPPKLGSAKKP